MSVHVRSINGAARCFMRGTNFSGRTTRGTLALNQVGRESCPALSGRQGSSLESRPFGGPALIHEPRVAGLILREWPERQARRSPRADGLSQGGGVPALVASTAGTSSNNLDLGSLEGDNAYDQASFPALD
jgi:hypothetical protein